MFAKFYTLFTLLTYRTTTNPQQIEQMEFERHTTKRGFGVIRERERERESERLVVHDRATTAGSGRPSKRELF